MTLDELKELLAVVRRWDTMDDEERSVLYLTAAEFLEACDISTLVDKLSADDKTCLGTIIAYKHILQEAVQAAVCAQLEREMHASLN